MHSSTQIHSLIGWVTDSISKLSSHPAIVCLSFHPLKLGSREANSDIQTDRQTQIHTNDRGEEGHARSLSSQSSPRLDEREKEIGERKQRRTEEWESSSCLL
mmetsp:Transcript_22429/g.44444  ORF Transcript_22429/g.44444 Transcript_22429/m.44444 type:complete len:102 (-) Transcript_22429:517-822(-)